MQALSHSVIAFYRALAGQFGVLDLSVAAVSKADEFHFACFGIICAAVWYFVFKYQKNIVAPQPII